MQISVPRPEGCQAAGIEQVTLSSTGQLLHTMSAVCGDRGPVTSVYEPGVGARVNAPPQSAEAARAEALKDLATLVAGMCLNCPNRETKLIKFPRPRLRH